MPNILMFRLGLISVSLVLLTLVTATPFAAGSKEQSKASYSRDEFAIRTTIYERHIVKSDEIYFVRETKEFVADLQRLEPDVRIRPATQSVYDNEKNRPVDIQTREAGSILCVEGLSMQGDEAKAGFSWYSAPLGAAFIFVKLKKQEGRWVIVEWRYDAIS